MVAHSVLCILPSKFIATVLCAGWMFKQMYVCVVCRSYDQNARECCFFPFPPPLVANRECNRLVPKNSYCERKRENWFTYLRTNTFYCYRQKCECPLLPMQMMRFCVFVCRLAIASLECDSADFQIPYWMLPLVAVRKSYNSAQFSSGFFSRCGLPLAMDANSCGVRANINVYRIDVEILYMLIPSMSREWIDPKTDRAARQIAFQFVCTKKICWTIF